MGRNLYSYLVMLAVVFGVASTVYSYPTPVDFEGVLLRWDIAPEDGPVTYFIKSEDDDLHFNQISLVEQAAEVWNAIDASYFRLERVANEEDAQITVNLKRELENAPAAAGYTTMDEHDGANPKHCSIFLATPTSAATYGFAKTALHEFGHCAGLGHSLIPQAIMSYSLESNAFRLDTDDIAAISRLYPADGSAPRLPPGCAITAASGSGTSRALWLALLLLTPLAVSVTTSRNRSVVAHVSSPVTRSRSKPH